MFWADEGLDTGPILLQRECHVEPNDTVNTIYKRFLFPEGVRGTVRLLLQLRAPGPRPPREGAGVGGRGLGPLRVWICVTGHFIRSFIYLFIRTL